MILFNGREIFGKFPNGELNLKKSLFDEFSSVYSSKNRILFKYESDADILGLLLLKEFSKERRDWVLDIVYMPYSRMDRLSEYVFTLKRVCELVNELNFSLVNVHHPHSDVTLALLNNSRSYTHISELLTMASYNVNDDLILYPDAGAYKTIYPIVKSTSHFIGLKTRDFLTGRITTYDVLTHYTSPIYFRKVIIVDDLCSKGGTFVLAAERLRDMGYKTIDLVVSHCESTILKGKLFESGLINKVYTTNSIININQATDRLIIKDVLGII